MTGTPIESSRKFIGVADKGNISLQLVRPNQSVGNKAKVTVTTYEEDGTPIGAPETKDMFIDTVTIDEAETAMASAEIVGEDGLFFGVSYALDQNSHNAYLAPEEQNSTKCTDNDIHAIPDEDCLVIPLAMKNYSGFTTEFSILASSGLTEDINSANYIDILFLRQDGTVITDTNTGFFSTEYQI